MCLKILISHRFFVVLGYKFGIDIALNIRTEFEVIMADLSSDEELSITASPEGIESPNFHQLNRPRTPETRCSICLDNFTNISTTNVCNHIFCFECLKQWSAVSELHYKLE